MQPKINFLNTISATIFLLFIALIVLLPSWHFMTTFVVWFMDGQRILELLLLSLVLIQALNSNQKSLNNTKVIFFNPKIHYVFFLLLGLAIVSSVLAISPRHALIEVSTFAALSYFAIYIANLSYKKEATFIKYFVYLLWASMLLYMVSFYVGYVTATVFKTPLNWPLPFNGFTNIRHFNQYQLWGLGLMSLPLLYTQLNKNTQIWLQIALAAWWVMLFYSASRGVLIAWFFGLLITALVYRALARPFLKLQLIQISTGFFAYCLLFKALPAYLQHQLVTGTVVRETTNDRLGLWYQAIELIKDSPVFGVGPMHFAWHYETNAHPHNSILQFASEFGLPFTFILLAIAAYGICCWIKRFNANSLKTQNAKQGQLAVVLFFTVTANLAYSLVDGVIVMPISQILMFAVIGLMIGHYFSNQVATDSRKAEHYSSVKTVFAGAVLLTLAWSTLPEIKQGFTNADKGFSIGYTAAGPRFWRENK